MQELYICSLAEPTKFSSPSFSSIKEATLIAVLYEPPIRVNMLAIGNGSGSGYFDGTCEKIIVVPYSFINQSEIEKQTTDAYKKILGEINRESQQLPSPDRYAVSYPLDLESVGYKVNEKKKRILKERIEQHNLAIDDESKLLRIIHQNAINQTLDDMLYSTKTNAIFHHGYAKPKEATQEDILALFSFLQKHAELLEHGAFSPESRWSLRTFYDDLAKSTKSVNN